MKPMQSDKAVGNQSDITFDSTCTMCGSTSKDSWETDPSRTVCLSMGSRFWDTPSSALSSLDECILCDECHEGVDGLRRSRVSRI